MIYLYIYTVNDIIWYIYDICMMWYIYDIFMIYLYIFMIDNNKKTKTWQW